MLNKFVVFLFTILISFSLYAQKSQKELTIQKALSAIKIDGNLTEPIWESAPSANAFTELRPTPFKPEDPANRTKVCFLYDNQGIYVGGYCYEKNIDSIATELIGRDGFGNNDFLGVIFDTYEDKLNGFEYFTTPLGEQMDAKVSASNMDNSEDFSWNAVWKSAAKLQNDGWTFEMFIPYSAIRFGKKNTQNWGLNIVRRRQKSAQQLFWNTVDPTINGLLTQSGKIKNLENIKPPVRLQLSPYISGYVTHDGLAESGVDKTKSTINGGIDVKYGINQAFTLDMTLVPDFGQVQSDNRVLNVGPFEQQFSENRAFFTEGTDLFSKGNLFYSRRIGAQPIHYYDADAQVGAHEFIKKNPAQSKIINATKISGRTQNGLGIGILNAITNTQYAIIGDSIFLNKSRKFETDPFTNYNVFVLNQSLKNNSSISFVNTNVLRSGKDYDANVSALLFDFNDKKNKWNIGGNIGTSMLFFSNNKNKIGYTHSLYFGKISGRFTFNIWQDLTNDEYDKNDLGYFTNNNTMDQGVWMGYRWNKPKGWYNNLRMNINGWVSRLVTPLDPIKGRKRMSQGGGINYNLNAQTKKFWEIGLNVNGGLNYNDFYEARIPGRVFANKGRAGGSFYWNSNSSKKLSWGGNFFTGVGGVFNRVSFDYGLYGKIRFNRKFSVNLDVSSQTATNAPGFAFISYNSPNPADVVFSRRDVRSVSNTLNIKYSFTNKMGLTLTALHNWTKLRPVQFYLLNLDGSLSPTTLTRNVNQNYNYFALDMVYTWQFALGSFLNVGWKNIGESFTRNFERNYFNNLDKTATGKELNNTDLNSLSIKVIYFLDYLSLKKHNHKA